MSGRNRSSTWRCSRSGSRTYLAGLRESRQTAEELADIDTVDLLTGIITEFEKNAWFLRASLDR